MNRHQRRAALKTPAKPASAAVSARSAETLAPPGFGLRLAASLLLSSWVLRRVSNPQVLAMLRDVARQAGRDGVVRQLEERLSHSS